MLWIVGMDGKAWHVIIYHSTIIMDGMYGWQVFKGL